MRRLFLLLASIALAAVGGYADAAYAQAVGATGRTTSSSGTTSTYTYSLSLGTIVCSGTTCTATSSTITPPSQVVFGLITFNSTHDAVFTVGGASGGGAGQAQVSCDGGTTWMPIAIGSGSSGISSPFYSYPTPSCTGPTNLNTLKFRLYLTGGGSGSSFNMAFTSPSAVTISW